MELSLILQGAFTGACAGLGCGSTCGSSMGVFLSGYLTSHSRGTRDSLRGFLVFYLGKILAVAGVCLGSSLLRRAVLDEVSLSSGGFSLPLAADVLMIGMGIFLVAQWVLEKKHQHLSFSALHKDGFLHRGRPLHEFSIPEKKQISASCSGCSHHSDTACARHQQALARMMEKHNGMSDASKTSDGHCIGPKPAEVSNALNKDKRSRLSSLTLLGAGAGYGLTPCAPLLLMAGYAASLSPANALLSGSVFAASSALSPLLILALLSGILSGKLKKEIPQYLDWFRLGAYVILIAIFAADMVKLL